MKPFRKCPVCSNAKETELLYKQEFMVPDGYEGIPDVYNIAECVMCGFVYSDVDASQEIYDNYYEKNSKYEKNGRSISGHLDEGHIAYFRGILQEFKEFINPESSILDIGCATGGMLCALREEGFSDLTGLEMSEACTNHVRNMGIDCYRGGAINKDPTLTKKFDLIIMTQVMEHIYDVAAAMKNIHSILKDDGLLYIDVPDAGRYDSHYIRPFHYFDIEHINHFTEKSMINLGLRSAFRCLKVWGRERGVSAKHSYPDLAILFQKSKDVNDIRQKCGHAHDNIMRYIKISGEEEERCLQTIHNLISSGEKVIIWGAGAYCFHFMKKGLERCNIAAIVDNDSKKQGLNVNDIKVEAPDVIRDDDAVIVIAAALFQESIRSQIADMKISNKVYCI